MAQKKRDDLTTTDPNATDSGATAGGALAGGAAGAGIGAVAGGPVGAVVGGAIGAVGGAAAGAAADTGYDEATFRKDYDTRGYSSRYSWDEASPAYRYGWESYDAASHRDSTYDKASAGIKKGWTSGKYADYEPMIRAGWEQRAQLALNTGGEAVVPVVEEQVKIGKRTVEKGGVRVETHVQERPVEETVNLHEEKVNVKRRAVDRPATDADMVCEGTLELTETAEEAVVSKKAKVVEEVVISKEARDRAETVRETAKRSDVVVEETAGTGKVVDHGTTKVLGWDDLEGDFRKTFKTTRFGKSGGTYEQYAPAYRFGYDLAADKKYAGKEWTAVEADARRHWEKADQGAWEDFKDAVQYAWDRVRGRR